MVQGFDTRNTFSRQVAERYIQEGFEVVQKDIEIVSLNTLLDNCSERIDYVSIDVEGLEFNILKDFDFDKYNISIFNIEKSSVNIKNLLLGNGYEIVAETISDWVFVKKGVVDEDNR